MALFDALIDDLATRFGLGATAAPLTREALALIVGAEGGLAGFLDLFKRCGLDALAASWLGRSDPQPLTAADLGKALGAPAIDGIAHRVGIALPSASAALAYALPRLVGILTPNGVVPAALPAEVMGLLTPEAAHAASEAAQAALKAGQDSTVAGHGPGVEADHGPAPEVKTIRARAVAPGWLWPLVGVGSLAALGWGVWPLLFPHAPPVSVPTQAAAPAPAPAPAPAAAEAPSVPSTLSVADDNGDAVVSGAVHDEQARGAILDALKSAFGADRIKGDVTVDANRSAAPWLANLPAALAALKIPGVSAAFEGASVKVGGAIVDADRERITASLKSLLGDGATVGAIADAFAGVEAGTNAKAATTLGSLTAGFSGNDLVATLNQATFGFPYGTADLPASVQGLIGAAANGLKTLPPGAKFEIAGYTDNSGDPAANVALSQKRADAVRDALVAAGAPSDALIARGYGGQDPIASNDTEAGRFKNWRIEFHLLNTPAPAAAASAAPAAATASPAAAPASVAAAATAPSTLSIDDQNGEAQVSGSVRDDGTRASIFDALRGVFGADSVKGDIAVDPNRADAPWLANLRGALDALKIPGLHALFEGGALTLSGAIPDLDRDKIAAALKSALGDAVTIAGLDQAPNAAPAQGAGTTAAPTAAAQPPAAAASTAPTPAAQPSAEAPAASTAPSPAAQPSTAPAAAAQSSTAQAAPAQAATAPAAAAQPSTLSIDDDANGVTVLGAVPDDQTHDSILDALRSVFGADAVKGDIAVDPNRAAAPWLAKLRDALAALKIPGLHAIFEGDAVNIGGAIPDRQQVVASLKSVFGDGVTVGALVGSVGDWETAANAKAAEALGKLQSGFSATDVVSALNLSIVNFATDSFEVPSAVTGVLQSAANDLKGLPPGYEIEVAGYTDSTGDADGNLVLSQKRAEAVREALVKAGASADMLTAKGYGAANPVASNDTEEGRFRNRRIEYHILKSPS